MELTEQTRREIEIAKMMGAKLIKDTRIYVYPHDEVPIPFYNHFTPSSLDYHTDAWIFPVIRKISEMVCPDGWDKNKFNQLRWAVISCPCYTETIKLFIAVSDFAEWFNNQNQ